MKLHGVTAQRRRCAPPRPSGHCSPAGSPSAPATAGRKLGEGKGKCPAGQSAEHGLLPGVPAGNHEWEPREAQTLHREPRAAPALYSTAAGCHCNRAAEPPGRRREARARVQGSARPRARRAPEVLPSPRPLLCPVMLGSGVQTSLHPPGLWRPLPSPPTRNEPTNPFARRLMGSLLWRHANHPHSPPQPRSSYPGIDSTERHTPTKRAPWRSGASLPIAEMEVALRSRMPAAPPMVQCPSAPATASVPGGGGARRKDGRRVRITCLRCCCGVRATAGWVPVGWVPSCIFTAGSTDP